jgi:glucose-6-phosphate isomerase
MQEFAEDNPGVCFAVYGNPGDIIIVPPSWAHATISADPSVPLTFGAWCDQDYGFEYESVRNHNGLAWYPLLNDKGDLTWFENKNYSRSDLIEKSPNTYNDLGIVQGISIYSQYEKNPSLFSFVPKPYSIASYWKNFMP